MFSTASPTLTFFKKAPTYSKGNLMLFSQIKLGVPSIWLKTTDYARTTDSLIKFNQRSFYTIDPLKGYSKFIDNEWKSILILMPNPQNPEELHETTTFDFTVAYTHLLEQLSTNKESATFLYSVYTKPEAMMEMFSGLVSMNNTQYRSAFWSDDLEQMPLQLVFMSWFDCPEDFKNMFYQSDFEEPNLEELATIITHIDDSSGNTLVNPGTLPAIAKAAIGLTESDFINVCLNSVLENGKIDADYALNDLEVSELDQETIKERRDSLAEIATRIWHF